MGPKKKTGENDYYRGEEIEALQLKLELARIENQATARQLELEKVRKEQNLAQIEIARINAVQSEKQREHELEMHQVRGTTARQEVSGRRYHINVPHITDNCDPTDILIAFERTCNLYGVPETSRVEYLIPFLGERALKAFTKIPEIDSNNYDRVKRAILKAFQRSPEEHRKKFRNMRKKYNENYTEFIARLQSSFNLWIEGMEIPLTYESLRNQIIIEQFEAGIETELQIWLADRNPNDIDEIASLSDKFCEVRDRRRNDKGVVKKQENLPKQPLKTQVKCYLCKEDGHKSFECEKRYNAKIKPLDRREIKPVINKVHFVGLAEGKFAKEYERKIILNKKPVTAYRDTGAFKTLVRKELVKPEDYTGEKIRISTITGSEAYVPMAEVTLEIAGKTKIVEMAAIENLPFDILLGNDVGCILRPIWETDKQFETEAIDTGNHLTANGSNAYIQGILINDKYASALRDSGANISVVKPNLILPGQYSNRKQVVQSVSGKQVRLPVAKIKIEDRRGKRMIDVAVSDNIPTDFLWGNLDGPKMKPIANYLIVTRQQTKKQREAQLDKTHPPDGQSDREEREKGTEARDVNESSRKRDGREDRRSASRESPVSDAYVENEDQLLGQMAEEEDTKVADLLGSIGGRSEFAIAQSEDQEIKELMSKVNTEGKTDENARFYVENGILMREWRCNKQNRTWQQLVVPKKLRAALLHMAHDNRLGGHLGVKKSRERLLKSFYWPGIFREVAQFVESCDSCQKTRRSGKGFRAPLHPIPIVGEAFYRVGVDLIGPLSESEEGFKYVLTVICYATKYPEAVPLKTIEAETIIEELIKIFGRVGFPKELICDQGRQFIAGITQGLWARTGVKLKTASVYHPQSNGQVENFNCSFKKMLRSLTDRYKTNWDALIPYVLFAYREIPQESTGFSPFELLFGRDVRGPLDILKNVWTSDNKEEKHAVTTYLCELRNRIAQTTKLAVKHMKEAQTKQRTYYDKSARNRVFSIGQQVLVLRPIKVGALEVAWDGPFEIKRQISHLNYEIDLGSTSGHKTYHVNMLKPYRTRTERIAVTVEESIARSHKGAELQVKNQERDVPDVSSFRDDTGTLQVGDTLDSSQKAELYEIIERKQAVFQNKPGCTNEIEHEIKLTDREPFKVKQYRMPWGAKKEMRSQIEKMLEWGVIERSSSEYANPVLMVPKEGAELRFCVDMRVLNKKSKADSFPTPHVEDALSGLRGARFKSKIDLFRGYWQIKLTDTSKELTAFRADNDLYHFNRLPFGLNSSAATFIRLMNKILKGCENYVKCYIDDLLIYSETWEEHLKHINEVLGRLENAGLTAKIEKCQFGVDYVNFLGFRVGPNGIEPGAAKVEAIRSWPRPANKKSLRSFLGTCSYYRKCIKNFASIAQTLYDLTKKNVKEFVWTDACEGTFEELKYRLTTAPVLASPLESDDYLLQTDASDRGIGAVLNIIDKNGREKPVLYLSRSLTHAEVGYSTIEKEALALVWAVEKIRPYIFMKNFKVQTDHNPITFIHQMRDKNRRILRWSLLLQEYQFEIEYKRGTANSNADGLSRRF